MATKEKKTKQVSVICLEGKQMLAQIRKTRCSKRIVFRQVSQKFILGIDPKDPNFLELFRIDDAEIYCPVGILALRAKGIHGGICRFSPFYD